MEEPIRRQTPTPDNSSPRYSKLEIERRFLVDPALLPDMGDRDSTLIEDLYLSCGRLRLRKMTDSATGEVVFKFCKKYGSIGDCQEPITNLYLTEAEYLTLSELPGAPLSKRRYRHEFQGRTFSIDIHVSPLSGLVLCEIEAPSLDELLAISFPPFARSEVTDDARYSGSVIARTLR